MNLLQLSKNVANLLGKDQKEVKEILEVAFADISSTLVDEETVYIHKFGKWEILREGGRPHFKLFNYIEPEIEPENENIKLLNRYLK